MSQPRSPTSPSPPRRHHLAVATSQTHLAVTTSTSPPRCRHLAAPPRRRHLAAPPRRRHLAYPPRRRHLAAPPRLQLPPSATSFGKGSKSSYLQSPRETKAALLKHKQRLELEFEFCKCQRSDCSTLIALLQPAPQTYQGPRENVLGFFEYMGFKCPQRKGVADFLQEVTSEKDHPAALSTRKYGVTRKELFKACMVRQMLLTKRNSFVYIFKLVQLILVAVTTMSLFFHTVMDRNTVADDQIYMGALFYTLLAGRRHSSTIACATSSFTRWSLILDISDYTKVMGSGQSTIMPLLFRLARTFWNRLKKIAKTNEAERPVPKVGNSLCVFVPS